MEGCGGPGGVDLLVDDLPAGQQQQAAGGGEGVVEGGAEEGGETGPDRGGPLDALTTTHADGTLGGGSMGCPPTTMKALHRQAAHSVLMKGGCCTTTAIALG